MAAIAASLASVDGRGRAIPAIVTRRTLRRRWPIGVAVVIVLVAASLLAARPGDSRADDHSATAPTTSTEMSSTTVRKPTRVWPASLHGDGSTWELGDADDRTPLGDWNCDGVETPALVDRPTGDVFVVDRWPEVEAAARYITTITEVIDVSVERGSRPTCDRLVVSTADGRTIRVSLSA